MNKLKSMIGTFAVVFSIQPLAAWALQEKAAPQKSSDSKKSDDSGKSGTSVSIGSKASARGRGGSICEVRAPTQDETKGK